MLILWGILDPNLRIMSERACQLTGVRVGCVKTLGNEAYLKLLTDKLISSQSEAWNLILCHIFIQVSSKREVHIRAVMSYAIDHSDRQVLTQKHHSAVFNDES